MFFKKSDEGYKEPAKGVQLKSLSHGEKTHLCEFRLKAGSVIPEHSHPHEQTGCLISGKLRFFAEEITFDAEPGDSWSFLADVVHGAEALEDSVIVEVFSPLREDYL